MKLPIYHLIILDESGSMTAVKNATISGCNETLNGIRSMQAEHADDQEHLVSIFLFQSNERIPSRYIIKNCPIESVSDVTPEQYNPWGCTPLFDAIGSTVVDLKACMCTNELSVANVTVITDGEENSSRHYDVRKITKIIEEQKKKGWNFNFIGANIDVERYANTLHFDNYMSFNQDEAGTREMFARESRARSRWNDKIAFAMECCDLSIVSEDERMEMFTCAKKGYYDEDSTTGDSGE